MAQEVCFGAGAGGLLVGHAEQRTHALGERQGAAMAAAVTMAALGTDFTRLPAQPPVRRFGACRRTAAQGPSWQTGVRSNDFARIEKTVWIEDGFQFPKD